ncbi:leucine--tRNA ligase, partial [bacterium]
YEPGEFEAKWRARWAKADLFRTRTDEDRPKFYGLDFFPFPSGAGLSVGHCRNYVPTDVLCRMKAMQGFNVLHPMGFDAFGLPAENEAIKRKSLPGPMIDRYAANYRRQMDLVGISYDWSRSFKSSDPSYYKWTQWIFEILWRRGLAYRQLAAVNWDPVDKTVLANEEVIGGRGERSGALVETRYITQWFFRITEYAQRLLDDLEGLDWPEGIKAQQRNWIGRSEGVQFSLRVADPAAGNRYDLASDAEAMGRSLAFEVFTTRIDTVYGMTFCVLAPEHPLVDQLPNTPEDKARVAEYREAAGRQSDADRTAEGREKTGVPTGAYAINPVNGARVPIWVADYVLATYGTGAIMAVPAHDQRDFEFALKFGLDVIPVIRPDEAYLNDRTLEAYLEAYLEDPKRFNPVFAAKDGVLMNSGEWDGQPVAEAQRGLGEWIEAHGIGQRKVTYRLRDWLISRQRYWGCPIPIIHTADGVEEAVPFDQLPVELPVVENYEPAGDGTSPLAHIPEFLNVTGSDGKLAQRETDTMGGFADSSWYFLRFIDPENPDEAWNKALADAWMPVDTYVGGAEHAVLHLLYARFWTKVLHDEGLIEVVEPFKSLKNQGQVLGLTPYRYAREGERLDVGEEGVLLSFAEAATLPEESVFWRYARMSKSKGNVVTPDEAVEGYGADALRLYLLFRAPFDADIQWETTGMADTAKFLSRVFRLFDSRSGEYDPLWRESIGSVTLGATGRAIRKATHVAIRETTRNVEAFSFNTYVSELMKYLNALNDAARAEAGEEGLGFAWSEALDTFALLLSPGAPHSADELWESLGHEGFTFEKTWPTFDLELAREDEIEIAVQVNGKLRDRLRVAPGTDKDELERLALVASNVLPHIEGKTVRKVIVVPDKLVSVVAN